MTEEYPIGMLAHSLLQAKEMKEHGIYLALEFGEKGYDVGLLTDLKISKHWKMYGYAEHFRERIEEHAELQDGRTESLQRDSKSRQAQHYSRPEERRRS